MKTIKLKPERCETPEALHALLARELDFPDHYGHNLDALHDCLTDIRRTTAIVVPRSLLANDFIRKLIPVLRDAAQANPRVSFRIE